jgi:charged multivesicular body protein 5
LRIETFDKKISQLEGELRKYKQQIAQTKSPATKNMVKQRAVRILKQLRMYEKQRDQLLQQSFNFEQANFAEQSMKDAKTTVFAMKTGVKSMKTQYKSFNITELEDVQDELQDMMEYAEEINETLSRSYDIGDVVDENELEEEVFLSHFYCLTFYLN